MNNTEVENIGQAATSLPFDRPRKSGFVLKPMNPEVAMRMLDSLIAGDEEDAVEQRETFSLLKQAIDEGRRLRGERLLFADYG